MLDLIILLIFLFVYFYKYETFNNYQCDFIKNNTNFSYNKQLYGNYHFLTDEYKCNYLLNVKKKNKRTDNDTHPLNTLLYNQNLKNLDTTLNFQRNLPFKKLNLDNKNFIPTSCTVNDQNKCININLSEVLQKIPISTLNKLYVSETLDIDNLKEKLDKIYNIQEYLITHLEKFKLNDIQFDKEKILEIKIEKSSDCGECFECKFLIDIHINELHTSFKLFIHFEYSTYHNSDPSIILKKKNSTLDIILGYIYINKIKIVNSTHLKHFVKGYDYKKKYVSLNPDKHTNIKNPYNGYQDYIRNSTESDNLLSKTQRENILQDKLNKKEENLQNCFYNRDECINTNIPVSFKSWTPSISL